MAADNDDPQAGEAAGHICADSFLRRPSLKDVAMETIGVFMNNAVLARHRPVYGQEDRFDAAALFLFKDQARALLSGTAGIFMFSDGELFWHSASKRYPDLGISPAYRTEAEPVFDLPRDVRERAAVLICSGILPDGADTQMLRDALKSAELPGDWLREVMPRIGEDRSALAAFLPPRRSLFS